jgi:hypothetical protein
MTILLIFVEDVGLFLSVPQQCNHSFNYLLDPDKNAKQF